MVFCIDINSAPNFNRQINKKGCSIIDCDADWKKNRKTIFAHNNVCIQKCDEEYQFWFDYKCYYRCPDDTFPENLLCIKMQDNTTTDNVTCNVRNFYMLGCQMDLNNNTAIQKLIEKTFSGLMNSELYDLAVTAIDKQMIFLRKIGNITLQIYSLDNKKRNEDLTYLDFGECIQRLKKRHNNLNDKLLVFKIEYNSPYYKIPIIEYNLFGRGGKTKLNLHYCNGLKVNYYIPREISNYEEYLYDPENRYYTDRCYPFSTDYNTDLTLYERKHFFNINNMSLCESICKFKGYLNNKIICECEIKFKFNSFLNVNSDKYNIIYRFQDDKLTKSFNIWVMKCFFNIFTLELLKTNLTSFAILIILFVIIIGTIIFVLKEKYIFFGKIHNIIEGVTFKLFVEGKIIPFKEKNKHDEANNKNDIKTKLGNCGHIKKIKSKNIKMKLQYDLKNNQSSQGEMQEKNESHTIVKLNEQNSTESIKNKNIIKTQMEILEKTDNELNFLNYNDAKLYDNRGCMKYYISLIRTKDLIIFPFATKNDFNPHSMKICFLFLMLGFILTISVLFLDDYDFHQLYISKGAFNIFNHLQKLIYSSVIILVIKNILLWTIFTERNFLEIKNRLITGKIEIQNKDMAKLSVKCACFFPLSIILLSLFWVYTMCFGSVFRNSHFHIFKISIINFCIQITLPFVFNIIPCIFRTISLRGNKNKAYLYRFSQLLQLI